MLLQVNADGSATIIPGDVDAAGTGTIDADGNVDVTTGFDSYAQGALHFTGVLALDADGGAWQASGAVSGEVSSEQGGTWVATKP